MFSTHDVLCQIVSFLPLDINVHTSLHISRSFRNATFVYIKGILPKLRPLLSSPFHLKWQQMLTLEMFNLPERSFFDFHATTSLTKAIASGAFPKLKSLYLSHSNMGDDGVTLLSNILASSERSLPNLKGLWLGGNNIGDIGITVFTNAIAKGILPSIEQLWLAGNKIGDAGMIAMSGAIDEGAFANVREMTLSANAIGDDGVVALSEACVRGALPELNVLNLAQNNINDHGMRALSTAIAGGILVNLKTLVAYGNDGDTGPLAIACHVRDSVHLLGKL